MNKLFVLIFCLLWFTPSLFCQTLKGIVLDHQTNLPIESASVYFDGTSIGTSTNSNGEFKIDIVQGVTSPLIISFIGYQKTIISNYESGKFYKILMSEDLNTLDEVVISADDGMPKELKLQHFRREFLGKTDNGNSCKILNESDLILRFNSKTNQLTASSKRPVQIRNENLKYLVSFDIQDFVIEYNYVDVLQKQFKINSVVYTGTSFYSDLDSVNTKRTLKKRDKTYEGSVLHFMRALYKKDLEKEGYQIFNEGFKVPAYKYIDIQPFENGKNMKVILSQKIVILYDKTRQSILGENKEGFLIDKYGNYAPIEKVLFGGDMGNQRIGDLLPFDYQLIDGN